MTKCKFIQFFSLPVLYHVIQYSQEGDKLPKNISISKDNILNTALEIVREKGIDAVSNREIAKKLNCSIRPIYYQFKNSEELMRELNKVMIKFFYDFLTNNMNDEMPKYKQTGINYIKFAKEEKNIFKVLFMSKTNLSINEFIDAADGNFNEVEKYINMSTSLVGNDLKSFHVKMWLFTHGIATLIASSAVNLSDEEISNLLSSEFKALMLLGAEK